MSCTHCGSFMQRRGEFLRGFPGRVAAPPGNQAREKRLEQREAQAVWRISHPSFSRRR
jgi:hypothetical protein